MYRTKACMRRSDSLLVFGIVVATTAATVAVASNAPRADLPEGFGAGTTGGLHGEVVRVKSRKDLAYQLCHSSRGTICTDDTPRIIQIEGAIDFAGTEGASDRAGCQYGNTCKAPYKTEVLTPLDANDKHCDGHPVRMITIDNAGNNPLPVGSNKTVIGVGANATLKGKGLLLNGVHNVVIRNLAMTDINQGIIFAGDALAIAQADHVWIDHNRFHNIGRQMIAAGFGATINITISWNDFDGNNVYSPYCNGEHYWNLLFGGNPQTITISNNYFHEVSGRAPHIDSPSAVVHLLNNYFHNEHLQQSGGFFHALDAGPQVKVLVEGNYFDNIETPITKTGGGSIFGVLGEVGANAQAQCVNDLGRKCAGNMATPTPAINRFVQNEDVIKLLGAVPKGSVARPFLAGDVPAVITANVGPGHL